MFGWHAQRWPLAPMALLDLMMMPYIFYGWHQSLDDSLTVSNRLNPQESHRLAVWSLMPKQKRTLQSSPLEIACPQATTNWDAAIPVLLPMWHPLEVVLSIEPSIPQSPCSRVFFLEYV